MIIRVVAMKYFRNLPCSLLNLKFFSNKQFSIISTDEGTVVPKRLEFLKHLALDNENTIVTVNGKTYLNAYPLNG